MGRSIIERLAGGDMDPQLAEVFDEPWDILEVAAMSLAFEDVMTALDLAADAVLLMCGEPLRTTGQFYDMGQLKKMHHRLAAPIFIRAWIDHLVQHPDLKLLEECRHPLTHRYVRRHIGVRVGGTNSGRALSEITTLHGRGAPRGRGSLGVLIPQLVTFGEAQVEALCQAILSDFPAPQ